LPNDWCNLVQLDLHRSRPRQQASHIYIAQDRDSKSRRIDYDVLNRRRQHLNRSTTECSHSEMHLLLAEE